MDFLLKINKRGGGNFSRKIFLEISSTLKGRKVLRKKFLRFITSKILYSAEEIFAVRGLSRKFCGTIFLRFERMSRILWN